MQTRVNHIYQKTWTPEWVKVEESERQQRSSPDRQLEQFIAWFSHCSILCVAHSRARTRSHIHVRTSKHSLARSYNIQRITLNLCEFCWYSTSFMDLKCIDELMAFQHLINGCGCHSKMITLFELKHPLKRMIEMKKEQDRESEKLIKRRARFM